MITWGRGGARQFTCTYIISWPSIDQYYPSTCLSRGGLCYVRMSIVDMRSLSVKWWPMLVDILANTWSICWSGTRWYIDRHSVNMLTDGICQYSSNRCSWSTETIALIVRVAKSNSELQSLDWIVLLWLLKNSFAKKFYHWIPNSWCYKSIVEWSMCADVVLSFTSRQTFRCLSGYPVQSF